MLFLDLVQVPDGSVGGESRQIGIAAASSVMEQVSAIHVEGTEAQRDAGFGQSSLDEQLFFTDLRSISQVATSLGACIHWDSLADHAPVNNELPSATNSHTVQSQLNSTIVGSDEIPTSDVVLDAGNVTKSNISIDGTLIDQRAIGIANSQIRGELSSPSSNGASSNLDILALKQFLLLVFQPLSKTLVQYMPLEGPKIFSIITSGLAQDENQDDQSAFHHESSVSSSSETL